MSNHLAMNYSCKKKKLGHESSYKEDTFSTRDHCKHPYKHHSHVKACGNQVPTSFGRHHVTTKQQKI